MTDFHFIQQLTFALFVLATFVILVRSWVTRGRLKLGTVQTSLVPLTLFLVLVFTLDFPASDSAPLLTTGLILNLLSLWLGAVAFGHLGWTNSDDFWMGRKEQKERTLVATGPFAVIRHPVFLSLALSYLGLTLVFLHPVTFILWLLAVIYVTVTSLAEEYCLTERFPTQYPAYARQTGRFFPKLAR